MPNYSRIAVDEQMIEKVVKLARKRTHIDDLAPTKCIEWMYGEMLRLEREAEVLQRKLEQLSTAKLAALPVAE